MSQFDAAVIHEIVTKNGATELRRILLGISKYCVKENRHDKDLNREDSLLYVQPVHHLDFVSRHGLKQTEAIAPKGYTESSHKREFEEWLEHGAPGLIWDDVLAYLRENPIT